MSQLASKELAVKLKALNYDRQCTHCYMHGHLEDDDLLWQYEGDDCFMLAPELNNVCDWLRTEHGLHVFCLPFMDFDRWEWHIVSKGEGPTIYEHTGNGDYFTALSWGIEKALDLVHAKMEGK